MTTTTQTRYPELAYRSEGRDWRFVDTSTGNPVGPYYPTRAELLADISRYARIFGCEPAAYPTTRRASRRACCCQ